MNHSLHTCLWFDGTAKSAADFYCSIFSNSKILSENPMVTMWELEGQKFMGLNGGPMFKPNPSVSFFVTCESQNEVDEIWNKLAKDATIMIPLNKYDWSEYYGFLQDKFGISWQIFKGDLKAVNQKIVPCFLFTDSNFGNAASAVDFYVSLFENSKMDYISFYDEGEMAGKNLVKHAQFILDGKVFKAMDGPGTHNYGFNEGISFVIECDTQAQIDYFWNSITANGGKESMCGWCSDKFGVFWQVIPKVLGKLMSDPEKGQKVQEAFLKMKKFDIETLMNV